MTPDTKHKKRVFTKREQDEKENKPTPKRKRDHKKYLKEWELPDEYD